MWSDLCYFLPRPCESIVQNYYLILTLRSEATTGVNHGSIHYRARSRNLVSPYHRAFVYLLCYFGGGVDTLEVCFGHLYRDELRVLPVRVVDQNLLHRRTCCLLPFRRLWTGVSGDICHHIWMFPCLPGVHGKRKEEDRNSDCKAKV